MVNSNVFIYPIYVCTSVRIIRISVKFGSCRCRRCGVRLQCFQVLLQALSTNLKCVQRRSSLLTVHLLPLISLQVNTDTQVQSLLCFSFSINYHFLSYQLPAQWRSLLSIKQHHQYALVGVWRGDWWQHSSCRSKTEQSLKSWSHLIRSPGQLPLFSASTQITAITRSKLLLKNTDC